MDGCNTSKTKLSFNLLQEKNNLVQGKWADLNPFEVGKMKALFFSRKSRKS